MGRESKMLCNEVTNAYTTWHSLQQKFVAIGDFWLIQQTLLYRYSLLCSLVIKYFM